MDAQGAPRIAIVGMAGRFPGAPDLARFWDNLRNGVESIAFFTRQELAQLGVDPAWLDNPSFVPAAARLDTREQFDAAFFGYGAQEAELIDPQQRVFLETAWEALESAGYMPESHDGLIGVYSGSSQNTYVWFNLLPRPGFLERHGTLRAVITNGADYLSTRTAYKLNLTGPALTVQSACSTSLVAVHLACQGLLNFECDLALAGGVSLKVTPIGGYQYEAGGLLSRDGHCRAFDAGATGTLFGEGAGVIVLKRLEDALRDGDTIRGVILGSAVNNDGAQKAGFTAPAASGQAAVVFQALESSGVAADTISYVEAHGTGTELGDPIEIRALTTAFRQTSRRNGYCAIGSVKTNIGHLDAAAGIAGLIKTVLAMEHGELPPSLHFARPNPDIDFAGSPFFVNDRLRPWTMDGPRRAGVSAFGIGGTNAHVVLEECPAQPAGAPAREPQLVVLSARTPTALARLRTDLAAALRAAPGIDLADVAFTLSRGRRAFEHRHFVVARTAEEAAHLLEQRDESAGSLEHPPAARTFMVRETPGVREIPMVREPDLAHETALRDLGEQWQRGQPIDWDSHWAGQRRRRVPLPTYPFERQRYWSDPRAEAATGADRPVRDLADWFSVPVWKQSAALPATRRDPHTWLVVGDAGGFAGAVADALHRRGEAVTVSADGAIPAHDLPGRVVCVTSEVDPFFVPLTLVQALATRSASRLALVTADSCEVIGGDALRPDGGLAVGVARVANHEVPQLAMRAIDLPLATSRPETWPALARHVVDEFDIEDAAVLVAYRGGRRWVQGFEPVRLPAADPAAVRDEGAYVITGGFGGVGLTFARALARRRARLALVGRTALDPRHHGDVRALEAAGARVLPLQADAADPASLRAALVQAQASFGRIDGVIHAAGIPGGGLIALKSRATAEAVLAPKVTGTRALLEACADLAPDFVALCSSVAALTGDVGQVDYAAANAYMDAAAHASRLPRTRVVSVDWDAWRDVGMAAAGVSASIRERREQTLARGIPPELGMEALLRALSQPHAQVVVSPAGIDLRQAEADAAARAPVQAPTPLAARHPRPALSTPHAAPRTDDERRLAALWEEVLGVSGLGVEDNFFELGGDSLLATQLLARLPTAFGRTCSLRELMACATIASMAEMLAAPPAADSVAVASGVPDAVASGASTAVASGFSRKDTATITPKHLTLAPLSFAQERLWLLDRLDPGNGAYVVPHAVSVRARVDPALAQRALDHLVARHDTLRTTIREVDGRPMQHIAAAGTAALQVIERPGLEEPLRGRELAALVRQEVERPFSLDQGPLFRTTLVTLGPDHTVLLFAMHHVISDAWSLEQVVREFAAAYDALAHGRTPELPPLPIQYADYAAWQREWFTGSVRARQVAYWTRQLAGVEPIDLPTLPRPPLQTFRGRLHRFSVPADVAAAVRRLARRHDTTLFMTLLAAFACLLRRYSGQEDIAVGTPIANRTRVETQHVVGLFANTLVMRVGLHGDPDVATLLARVRDVVLDAHAHQDLPFEQLVEALQPARDLSRNPLFQVFFIHRRRPDDQEAAGVTTLPVDATTTKFDLTLLCEEGADDLQAAFEFNTDLFTDAAVARLGRHLIAVLRAMTDGVPRVSAMPLLDTDERTAALATANGEARRYRADATVAQLVAEAAHRWPTREAVVCGGERLTYADLEVRARRLAGWLAAQGVGAEARVGIRLERSADMVVAALAVSWCGAAYVPLDPSFPAERLRLTIEDAAPALVVTPDVLRRAAADLVAPLDEPASCAADQLAYVIYTSGSTGRPKGVQITTGALMNFLAAMTRTLPIDGGDRLAAVTTFSFDIAGLELWGPLAMGGTVVLMTADETRDPRLLAARLAAERATLMQATPATWRMLLDAGWSNATRLRVLVGGEALPAPLAKDLLAVAPSVTNLYGPTETTIWSTRHEVRADGAVPIGLPIDNTRVYVLDERLEPVPPTVAGDLYIGGDGLARGYLHLPALTAAAFLPDPHGAPGERMYRTGDRARWREDGTLEFLGRGDDQVKVRGFRIELGDVEAALAGHASIERAVAGVRAGADGAAILVAWCIPAAGATIDEAALRAWVRERLPDYMVPSAFVAVDRVPLTPNAKVDRRALPAPTPARRADRPATAPRSDLERQMAQLWGDTLQAGAIGVDDDFFELGGHSMLAARLLSRVRDLFDVDVPLRALFEAPTIAGLARAVAILREGGSLETLSPALRAELLADSALDPAITLEVSPAARTFMVRDQHFRDQQPHAILLTGATGFLGAHLLAELLTSTAAGVHCLVRCEREDEGAARLRGILQRYELWQDAYADRIAVVPGDLDAPRFGLTHARFDALARGIDAIYHNGALVNFVMPYRRLRPSNVGGTVEVLRLAATGPVTPVHYVSTMDVLGADYLEATEEHVLADPAGLVHGYAQSKWVGERLVAAARGRGIPAAIYRPARIIGHSRTGIWNTDDFACRAIKGSIELGVVPDVDPIDNMSPVDYVSRAIVHLSLRADACSGAAYHVVNPQYYFWQRLFALMRRWGYTLETVSYREWRRQLARSSDNALKPLLALFPVPPDEGEDGSGQRWSAAPPVHCDRAAAALAGGDVTCPPLDEALWARYFDFFVRAGYIARPEGACSFSDSPAAST